MGVKVNYRADQADRNYGRSTGQVFQNVDQALQFLRTIPLADLVSITDEVTGQAALPGVLNLATALPGNVPINKFTYIPEGWGDQWRIARDQAPSRLVKFQAWGDSNTVGDGSTDRINRGWFGLVGDVLKTKYGDGGSGYLTYATAPTSTGTWTAEQGFSGAAGRATAAATKSWVNIRGTTIRIFYRNIGVVGVLRYRIDGGSFTNITPPTAPTGNEPGFVEVTGLANVPHTLDIEWVSGAIVLHGIQGSYNTGIATYRCAQGSRAGSDYSMNEIQRLQITTAGTTTITAAAPGSFTPFMQNKYLSSPTLAPGTQITAVASATSATIAPAATGSATETAILGFNPSTSATVPYSTVEASPSFGFGRADVLMILLGVIDAQSATNTAASFRNGLSHIISAHTFGQAGAAYTYAPDVIVIVEHTGFSLGFDVDLEYSEDAAVVRDIAEAYNAAVIDFWAMGRHSFQGATDMGLLADFVHMSNAGHATVARAVLNVLDAA
jgi:lysophospholipase L1-like esterase